MSKKHFLILFTFLLVAFALSPIFVFAQESKSIFDAGVPPKLQMPIPGTVEFSKIKVEGGTISVPWLAEYIAGIYKYAIALAVTLAIFMVMVGGFLWITAAGDKGKIGKATEIITDAVVGLILAVGSYVILYTINPDVLEFKALRVGLIETVPWDVKLDMTLATTHADTIDPDEPAVATPTFKNCPVTLTQEANPSKNNCPSKEHPGDLLSAQFNDPRSIEFKEKISSIISPSISKREKIATIAQAAAKCGIGLGSCGCTVNKIYAMAGAQKGNTSFSITNDQMKFLDSIKCPANSTRDCRTQAKKTAYDKFKNEISGWPDSWITSLQPGDHMTVFNAFSQEYGTHSTIFVGWKSQGKIANVIQGAWGKFVSISTIDLRTTPLVRIHPPQ